MPEIHPTAVVADGANLADDVEVGPFCVIESDVTIGPGCKLHSNATIRRHTTLGADNTVDSFAVLGGQPQDYKFDPGCVSYLKIGDGNIFREGVTVSRGTGEGAATVIGNRNFFMANSHAGHNVVIADGVVLVNNVSLGGFVHVCSGVNLSLNVGIHQFVRIGELAMLRGNSSITTHVPPYVLAMDYNRVSSLNGVGLRRAEHISDEDRRQIKEAFEIVYQSGLPTSKALARMDACTDWSAAAVKFREFIRWAVTAEPPYNRGLCASRRGRKR